MRHRYIARAAIPLIVGALALTGCGSNKGKSGTSGGGHEVVIGMSAPLSGGLSALGLGMRNSVKLAVDQANKANKVKGWTIKFDPQDDQADANVGGQVAARLASEKNVVAVVGTLNSSVAQQEQQTFNDANIVMISPANTNPSLTQGPDFAKGDSAKKRPFKSYFRVATTDAIQGPFAAQYLISNGIKKIATVNDKKTYGQGLVQEFEKEFKKEGGTITAHLTVGEKDKDFSAVISKIKPTNPQALYYGGEYPVAGPLSKQMKDAGLNVPLMGGDGIYDPTFIKLAGPKSEGDLATSVGAPTDQLASAKSFVEAYRAAGFKEDFSAYGAYSFDAVNVVIDALAKVLPGKDKIDDSVKQAIVDAVQSTNMQGVTGTVSFDQYGDTTNKVLTVYKVTGGAWKPEKTEAFNK